MGGQRKTVYLHIGLERTGTTSLQRYCARNVNHLLRQGVLYPTRSAAFAHGNHAPLAASYLPAGRPVDHHLRGDDTRRVVDALRAEIDASRAPAILISSEHLSSRLRGAQVEALARDLAPYDCKVLVCLREHFDLLSSSYATHVRSGSTDTFEDYAAMVCAPGNTYLRHADALAAWEAAFGLEAVEVIGYARGEDSVGAVFGRLGLRAPAGRGAGAYNQSLDQVSTEALRTVNVALRSRRPAASESYVEFRRQDHIRSRVSRRLARATEASADWVMPDAQRPALLALATADRLALARAYGIDLGPMGVDMVGGGAGQSSTEHIAEHLALALVQSACERPAERALMASRGVADAVFDRLARLKAKVAPRLRTSG